MTAEQLRDNFYNNLKRLHDDNKGIIRTNKSGITRLRRYSRDVSGEGTKTYEHALSDLHPSEETRNRLEGKSDKIKVSRGDKHNSILANTFLEK